MTVEETFEFIRSQISLELRKLHLVGEVSFAISAEMWQHSRGNRDPSCKPVNWCVSLLAPPKWRWGDAPYECERFEANTVDEVIMYAKAAVRELSVARETAELQRELQLT